MRWETMKTEILLDDQIWEIDTDNLRFTDATLNSFFERVSGIIDYVGSGLAKSNYCHSMMEHRYKQRYIQKFKEFKDQGKSDKTAELSAEGDPEVDALKKMSIEAKYKRDILYSHLQALNSAREDAHNRGHMLRKEMAKLNMDIMSPSEF
jgi:hypothetical protein